MDDRSPPVRSLVPVDFDPFELPEGEAFDLSEQQREMWVVTLMSDEANCSYNQCYVLRLRGPLAHESLLNALYTVVQRHEALRIRIDAAEARQQALARVEVSLPLIDLSATDAASREAQIAGHIERETREPFDLSLAPLWRACLIREAEDLHRLVLTAHHIVVDGWSSAVLFSDLATAYVADRFGLTRQLPTPASYRDFVLAQQTQPIVSEHLSSLEFWTTQFAKGVPSFALPLDHVRPPLKSYRAGREMSDIDSDLYLALRKVGAQHNATFFVTLLAAFEVLIARLSGNDEFVIGIPMASQALQENSHLIAHGVNTIPLLCRVDLQASFIAHLQIVREAFSEARAHQRVTFGSLVQQLRLPRDPSRTPLVPVIFNIDKIGSPFDFGTVSVEGIEAPKAFYNFEFGINAIDDGRQLRLECDYNSDLFDGETIRRWLSHYRHLLLGIVASPVARVADLPLLSPAERAELLGGDRVLPTFAPSATLHERFAQQVACTPEAIALTAFDADERPVTLSYAELDARAERVAGALRARGVGANQLVALRTERNAELVIGLIGILKAGGAYLPLDPVYPPERIRFMLNDAAVRIVLTQRRLSADLAGLAVNVLCLDEPSSFGSDRLAPPAAASTPTDLAYVIYTSGSTGQPKGVGISHANVLRLFTATEGWFGFNARDVWTLFHSYAFDFSVWELWGALLYGGRLVIVPHELSRNTPAFRELLIRESVSVLNQTPTAFRQLIDVDRACPPAPFALRYIIFGGEALELQSLKPWIERYGDHTPRLINMYGITETTVHVTYRPITRADLDTPRGSLIGQPIPDLRIYLLDPAGHPVPIGVPGEMFVAGAGVAQRGYLNRPELSAQRFLPNPFLSDPDARMYRSGDLARWLAHGELEYLGRIDSQVKIRGFRIELGEIEALLAQHPNVRQVAVVDREDVPGQKQLAAYLVIDAPRPALLEQLRERLRAALPDYMIPAHFLFLDALPLTHNGKLDRRALPAPENSREYRAEMIAPRTATEALVAAVYAQELNREDIGVLDNFFELGGDSLMAARVMARIRSKTNVDLPLRHLFERPTPERLAAAIDALAWTADNEALSASGTDFHGRREEFEL